MKALIILIVFAVSLNAAFPSGWLYRKKIILTNTDTVSLTNYQDTIRLSSSNFDFTKCKSDGADLRFTSNDGLTLLSYWIQIFDSTNTSAFIYVKTPSHAASGIDTIYLYYGNSEASSASSGDSTFPIFDDFEEANGIDGMNEWGTIRDGIAYWSSERDTNYSVNAFDIETFDLVKRYNFKYSYGTAPLVVQDSAGRWLVIGHETTFKRTRAFYRDSTDVVAWTSDTVHPGAGMVGLSYYTNLEGKLCILIPTTGGLYCVSANSGVELWKYTSAGSLKSPAVDQERGIIYYQYDNGVAEISAEDGSGIRFIATNREGSYAGNTVLVNDGYGYFIVTAGYKDGAQGGEKLTVYDSTLNQIWVDSSLTLSKKCHIAYKNGKVFVAQGDGWMSSYTDTSWRSVKAFDITDGTPLWTCDLSRFPIGGFQGGFVVDSFYYTTTIYGALFLDVNRWTFKININTGALVDSIDYGYRGSSCGSAVISNGIMFNPNLDTLRNRVEPLKIGIGNKTDWIGVYGDPQTNTGCAPDSAVNSYTPFSMLKARRQWNRKTFYKHSNVNAFEGNYSMKTQYTGGYNYAYCSDTTPTNFEYICRFRNVNTVLHRGGPSLISSNAPSNVYCFYNNLEYSPASSNLIYFVNRTYNGLVWTVLPSNLPNGTQWLLLKLRKYNNSIEGNIYQEDGETEIAKIYYKTILNGNMSLITSNVPDYWVKNNSNTAVGTGDDTGTIKVTATIDSGDIYQNFQVISGRKYYVSWRVKATTDHWWNVRVDGIAARIINRGGTNDTWVTVNDSFVATANGTGRIWLMSSSAYGAWYDDVSVDDGTEDLTPYNLVGMLDYDSTNYYDNLFVRNYNLIDPVVVVSSDYDTIVSTHSTVASRRSGHIGGFLSRWKSGWR